LADRHPHSGLKEHVCVQEAEQESRGDNGARVQSAMLPPERNEVSPEQSPRSNCPEGVESPKINPIQEPVVNLDSENHEDVGRLLGCRLPASNAFSNNASPNTKTAAAGRPGTTSEAKFEVFAIVGAWRISISSMINLIKYQLEV